MDQGNLINPGIVMSLEFFQRTGLSYINQIWVKLRTASVGTKLVTVGWTEPFVLRIQGITSQFKCQATVVHGLSEDVNQGSGFLQWVSTVRMDA